MTDPTGADHLARCEHLLSEAEAYERAGDWDNAVVKYRELNALDHLYKGAEAKLLFALTERDAGKLYAEGKELMRAGRYLDALESFRKAKVRAGVYKDTDALVRECQSHMTGAGSAVATPVTARKGCLALLLVFFA